MAQKKNIGDTHRWYVSWLKRSTRNNNKNANRSHPGNSEYTAAIVTYIDLSKAGLN